MEAWADMDGKPLEASKQSWMSTTKNNELRGWRWNIKKAQREEFLSNFASRIQAIVRPVMEEASELLKRSGHDCEIIEHSDGLQSDGKTLNAAIVLAIFPEGERPNDPRNRTRSGWPHIAFFVNPNKNTIFVHESAMMPNVGGPPAPPGSTPWTRSLPTSFKSTSSASWPAPWGSDG